MIKITYDTQNNIGYIYLNYPIKNVRNKKASRVLTISSDSTSINLDITPQNIYGIERYDIEDSFRSKIQSKSLEVIIENGYFLIGNKSETIDSFVNEIEYINENQKDIVNDTLFYLSNKKLCGIRVPTSQVTNPTIDFSIT